MGCSTSSWVSFRLLAAGASGSVPIAVLNDRSTTLLIGGNEGRGIYGVHERLVRMVRRILVQSCNTRLLHLF